MVGVEKNYKFNNNSISFTSRSSALKKADDIRRLVVREFSNTYSNTKLKGFNSIDKTGKFRNYYGFVGDAVAESRKYYNEPENDSIKLVREIVTLKKQQIGNCAEMSDVVYMALKLNGYKDAKIMNIYAYNTKTKKMRDLEHTIVGIDFKLPRNYEHCMYPYTRNMDSKHRIYPQNESIIVDAWGGFTEYGKASVSKYNSRRDLISALKKPHEHVKEGETLLKEDEQLCFVPIYDREIINPDRLVSYGKEYYGVIHPKNRGMVDVSSAKSLPKCSGLSRNVILRLKGERGLKGAPSDAEMARLEAEHLQSVYARWGIVPVKEPEKKKNLFQKFINMFK